MSSSLHLPRCRLFHLSTGTVSELGEFPLPKYSGDFGSKTGNLQKLQHCNIKSQLSPNKFSRQVGKILARGLKTCGTVEKVCESRNSTAIANTASIHISIFDTATTQPNILICLKVNFRVKLINTLQQRKYACSYQSLGII